ncbi:hypothetical protein PG985_002845 [Apiospora marii]|uniref:uncharacterized protein n=1 Tax=Apiospora marii TaxID=335849 RepID=UPI003131D9D4
MVQFRENMLSREARRLTSLDTYWTYSFLYLLCLLTYPFSSEEEPKDLPRRHLELRRPVLLPQVVRRRLGPRHQLAQGPDPADDVVHDALHALDELDLHVAAVYDRPPPAAAAVPGTTERQAFGEPRRLLDQVIRLGLETGRVPVHASPEVGRDLDRREVRRVVGAQVGVGGGHHVDDAGDSAILLGLADEEGV